MFRCSMIAQWDKKKSVENPCRLEGNQLLNYSSWKKYGSPIMPVSLRRFPKPWLYFSSPTFQTRLDWWLPWVLESVFSHFVVVNPRHVAWDRSWAQSYSTMCTWITVNSTKGRDLSLTSFFSCCLLLSLESNVSFLQSQNHEVKMRRNFEYTWSGLGSLH